MWVLSLSSPTNCFWALPLEMPLENRQAWGTGFSSQSETPKQPAPHSSLTHATNPPLCPAGQWAGSPAISGTTAGRIRCLF